MIVKWFRDICSFTTVYARNWKVCIVNGGIKFVVVGSYLYLEQTSCKFQSDK
jgi:hypothetical protein